MLVSQAYPAFAVNEKISFWKWKKKPKIEQTNPENNTQPLEDSLWDSLQPNGTQNLQAEKTQTTSDIKVQSVEITGNNLIDTAEIMQYVKIQQGDPYSVDMVQQNLKAIYDMGYFSEKMKAIPIKIDDKNIKLRFIVQENIPITDFNISGNNSVATGDLLQILNPLMNKP